MSNVDPGAENRGGGSFSRENLSDLDDVATAGAWHLSDVAFNALTSKWTYDGNMPVPVPTAIPGTAGLNAGVTPPVPVLLAGSTDARGQITFGTGATPGAATANSVTLVLVTFGIALPAGKVPFVDIQENNWATRAILLIPTNITNTSFTISYTAGTIAASQANTIYSCIYKVES